MSDISPSAQLSRKRLSGDGNGSAAITEPSRANLLKAVKEMESLEQVRETATRLIDRHRYDNKISEALGPLRTAAEDYANRPLPDRPEDDKHLSDAQMLEVRRLLHVAARELHRLENDPSYDDEGHNESAFDTKTTTELIRDAFNVPYGKVISKPKWRPTTYTVLDPEAPGYDPVAELSDASSRPNGPDSDDEEFRQIQYQLTIRAMGRRAERQAERQADLEFFKEQ